MDMRYIPFLILLGLMTGCATTQSIPTEDRSRTYEVPKDTVITAVVETFTAEGYPIETIDRETGMVITGEKSNSTMKAAFVGNKNRSLQAMVREAGAGRSRLVLTLTYESENAFGGSSAQSVGKSAAVEMYDQWFQRIESNLSITTGTSNQTEK